MSIRGFLIKGLGEAKVWPAIIANVLVMIALAYMVFQQSLLMQADLNVYSAVVDLFAYTSVECFLEALNSIVVEYWVILPFKLATTWLLSVAVVEISPASLLHTKEKTHVVKEAAFCALVALVKNGLTVITPIFLLLSRGAAIGTYLDTMQFIVVIACLTAVFGAGSAILAYDHRKKKQLSKEVTKLNEQARSFETSIATIVINGMARLYPNWLVNLEKKKSFPSTKHDVVMQALYGVLRIATTGVPIALVWVLKGKNAFLPLYIVILPMFWTTWYLFWTIKSLVVSIAPWAQFADFLNNSKPPPADLKRPTDPADIMPIFSDEKIKEIRLTGISGCGKSTMMKVILSQICDKFMSGFVIYLEQLASLPIGMTLRENFASSFSNPDVPPDLFQDKLFEYADILNLSNIVNPSTLELSFDNPSGGETKRIIFLRQVLPMLMENSHCMILFADESSAGLDEQSFSRLRVLIEEIKTKGVKVVSIDHHDYSTDKSVEVFKKTVQIPNPKSKKAMPSLLQKMMQKLFPFRYQEEKEPDLEMGEGATNIVVWAPALGIDEPQ